MKLIVITGSSPGAVAAAAQAASPSPTIVLTDPPAIVQLKRDFRELDNQEQELKVFGAEAYEELHRIRRCKEAIAREIFALKPTR